MKICMLTTFFGKHRFGGDAVYVDRLSRGLIRAGHEVHIIHSVDAFQTVKGAESQKSFRPADGMHVHPIKTKIPTLSTLWNHQTGSMGIKGTRIRSILAQHEFDVLHFHNISLLGGPKLLEAPTKNQQAIRLMSAHEFWLFCPLSLLWKMNRRICDRPECLKCCLRNGKPPQFWRYSSMVQKGISQLKALLFPSRHTLNIHRENGITHSNMIHLPYFLPEDWAAASNTSNEHSVSIPADSSQPYFALVGRLVKEKGFQDVIAIMDRFPMINLKIAGSGPYENKLLQLARDKPNVQFLGHLDFDELSLLYQNARALIVPSLFYETFGYIVLEAFSVKTPVIVSNRGAIKELVDSSKAGFTYADQTQLIDAIQTLLSDPKLASTLGERGHSHFLRFWSEQKIVRDYLATIQGLQDPQSQ